MDSFLPNKQSSRLWHWLQGLILLCCTSYTHADTSIAVLLSGNAPYYQQASEALQSTLHQKMASPPKLDFIQLDHANPKTIDDGRYQLIVTVGTSAAKFTAERLHTTPVLATFIPQSGFEKITRHLPEKSPRPFSAVFLDQPLSRLITLGQLLRPDATNIGTVLGPISQQHLPEFKQLSKEQPFNFHHALLDDQDNPVSALKPVVAASDLFIAVPDQAVLNRSVAKWILYLSFSKKIPVIGFSKAYTDAGALASVYSSPQNVGLQTGELVSNWLIHQDPLIWQPQYPSHCTLRSNPAVARSLGIKIPSDKELAAQFSAMENDKP